MLARSQVSAALDAAVAKFGRVDTLVQCAGIAPPAKLLGKKGPHSLDLFAKVVGVNLIGTFNVMRLAADRMAANEPVEGERGVIINTARYVTHRGCTGHRSHARSWGACTRYYCCCCCC